MVENKSVTAFTCPLHRRGALGTGNMANKRLKPLFDGTFAKCLQVTA